MKFVFINRQSNELVHKYDIVIGPVANDNLYQVLVNYEESKALECIKYIETIEVGE